MRHVSLDLETWGTNPDAAIISIGAVIFDPNGDPATFRDWNKFHVAIDPATTKQFNRQFDTGTLMWWMHADRRESLDQWLAMPKVSLDEALEGFRSWVLDRGDGAPQMANDQVVVWGNGSTFDNVLMRESYRAMGSYAPWSFRNDRDLRTLKSFASQYSDALLWK